MENFATDTQIHECPLRRILFLLFACAAFSLIGQNQLSSSNKKALKKYLKAEKEVKERNFESAIGLFQETIEVDGSFYEAYLRKGSLFNALGNEDSVYTNFVQYATIAPSPKASILERLAHLALDRGHYKAAKNYLSGFLERVPEKKGDKQIQLLEQSISFAFSQLDHPIEIEIEELPNEINRYGLQYLPTMTVDQKTLIYTKRNEFSSDEDIVVSYFKNGSWSTSKSVSSRINTESNEGAATISADGRTMIFTACDRRDSYGSCDLYISKKSGEVWSRPKNLGKSVNSKYWESQPSLSADGRTLYFASNRPGGFGGRDIWKTTLLEKKWITPLNLGKEVNSFKDETTPFVHFNGQTLFFSTNSYPGMGGFDLFVTHSKDSTWTKPENLGYPINSFRDEVALLISADGRGGFFAKEQQKNHKILDSKIVKFSVPENIRPTQSYFITGKVMDAETSNPLKASLQIVDIVSNELLYDSYSDSISGEFYLVLPANKQLAGYLKKTGYLYKNFNFSSNQFNGMNSDTLRIVLSPIKEGKSIVLKNIYFELDSYLLDSRSQSEINNVFEMLSINKNMMIEISGHTDDTGSETYNQSLSKKRARAVYEMLINNGISTNRLSYKGAGSSKPIKPNDSEVNRKSNRRIEFKVLR